MIGSRSYQMLIGALLLLIGSPFAFRIPKLQERKHKAAGDYAKIFGYTALAFILDFVGVGLLIGIWSL